MRKSGWQHEADLVYVSSVCFPDELNDAIGVQCKELKPGARVLSLKMFEVDVSEYLEITQSIKVCMTWGVQVAVIYTRK